MKRFIIIIEVAPDFEIGKCKTCKYARGSDQCKLLDVLTEGACSLNCFCPLRKIGNQNK
jgi:hypothetical protein